MKMVLAVILRQRISDAVQTESSMRDSVRISPDEGAEISRAVQISFQSLMAEYDVARLAMAIRNIDSVDDAAVVRNPYFHPLIVGQRE